MHRVVMNGDTIASAEVIPLPASGCPAPAPPRAAGSAAPAGAPNGRPFPEGDTTVLVTLRHAGANPRFPEQRLHELRNAPGNRAARERSRALVRALKRKLARRFGDLATGLPGVAVLDTFWLLDALQVRLPRAALPALRRHADVRFVEAPFTPPPVPDSSTIRRLILPGYLYQDTLPTPVGVPVALGRDSLGSDPYFDAGLTGGWVALLDQGIEVNHIQLAFPTPLGYRGDCVRGGEDCLTRTPHFFPYEVCAQDHGTQTGAVITANANQGQSHRGVTRVLLDTYRVFRCRVVDDEVFFPDLDYGAAVRGFQAAVAGLSKIIVAPLAGAAYRCIDTTCTRLRYAPERHGILIRAADRAFEAGAAVIAATGNTPDQVGQPAIARKALGIGSYTVATGRQEVSQGHRRTPDGRLKPDVQAPTDVLTAGSYSKGDLRAFAGTSGATAFAGGAAALLRTWLLRTSGRDGVDPGQLYAQMILAGRRPFPFNDSTGAGHLRLPPLDGVAWWGQSAVCPGDTLDLPLDPRDLPPHTLDAALWWPEADDLPHAGLDLFLLAPGGAVRARSTDPTSVFERAHAAGSGPWTLRIIAESGAARPQTVYWTAHARPQDP
jgi:hypothetical protein